MNECGTESHISPVQSFRDSIYVVAKKCHSHFPTANHGGPFIVLLGTLPTNIHARNFCFHGSLELERTLLQASYFSWFSESTSLIIPLIIEKRVRIENIPVLRFSASWGQTFISLPLNEASRPLR